MHLEYLQVRLLQFMLSSVSGYITSHDVEKDPEIFSVNLSKYIYEIKNKCVTLLSKSGKGDMADDLFDQIIEKKTIDGRRGYRLRTEFTDACEELSFEIQDEEASPASSGNAPSEPSDPDLSGWQRYFRNNWMALFLYAFLFLFFILMLDAAHISPGELLNRVVEAPFGVTFTFMCGLSVLPILGGVFLDVPLAVRKYATRNGILVKNLDTRKRVEIAMYTVPRFDSSRENVIFFLLCNLTGAFTVASEVLYMKSVPQIKELIFDPSQSTPFILTAATGCFVALYQNYLLQVSRSPARVGDDFILSRFHAFLNLLFLSVNLALGCTVIYAILAYRFFFSGSSLNLTPAYVVMLLSTYCFLWFSSDSPAAERIDSISKDNFLSGLPLVALFSTVFTILCFEKNLTCVVSLLTTPLFLGLWYVYLAKRTKSHSLKVRFFYTSFFSVMAICVVLMLVLNSWW